MADGTILSVEGGAYSAGALKHHLNAALKKFDPSQQVQVDLAGTKPFSHPKPPEGTLVAYVTSKVMEGAYKDEPPNKATVEYHKLYFKYVRNYLGSDRLWIRQDEADALAKGVFPESLKQRIVRNHVLDTTRFYPVGGYTDVKKLDLTLSKGRVSGSVHIEGGAGKRGHEADVLGFVEAKDGKLVRFDVVLKGLHWEEFQNEGYEGPKGKYAFAIALTLADPGHPAAQIPPYASKWNGYLQ